VISIYKQVPSPSVHIYPPFAALGILKPHTNKGGTTFTTSHCSYGAHTLFLDFQNQTLKKFSTSLCLFVFIYFPHYFFHDQ